MVADNMATLGNDYILLEEIVYNNIIAVNYTAELVEGPYYL